MNPIVVKTLWDAEANVWVATSDDVPGLATEAETLKLLDIKLKSLVPELLDANGVPRDNGQVEIEFLVCNSPLDRG